MRRIMILLVLSFFLYGSFSVLTNHAEGQPTVKYAQHVVTSGETLWSISKAYYKRDYDIRKAVYEIEKINNLDSAAIYEGQTLRIPLTD